MKKAGVSSILFVVILLAIGVIAEAQQPKKVPRIGFLSGGFPGSTLGIPSVQRELATLGYVEGKNIAFEYRYAEDKPERSPALADDLVRLKVDVIVAGGANDTQAAKNATKMIPIVFWSPYPIPWRSAWLIAWLGLEGTSPDLPPSRRCWRANDWSYSRKPFQSSHASRCCESAVAG